MKIKFYDDDGNELHEMIFDSYPADPKEMEGFTLDIAAEASKVFTALHVAKTKDIEYKDIKEKLDKHEAQVKAQFQKDQTKHLN